MGIFKYCQTSYLSEYFEGCFNDTFAFDEKNFNGLNNIKCSEYSLFLPNELTNLRNV